MNAIELLKMQHDEIERLFEDYEQADALGKREIFDQIADQLAVHSAIEEQHFYPALKSAETEHLLAESVEYHYEWKQMLAELIELASGAQGFDAGFDRKLDRLRAVVHRHTKEQEERELFPQARLMLDEGELDALGEEMTETMVTLESEGTPRNQVFEELDAPAQI
jgi:hypothetical protein